MEIIREETSKARVFISYTYNDIKWRDRIVTFLAPLMNVGLIETWSDSAIELGEQSTLEIKERITSCDIALLLISPDFLSSNFIWDIEVPALQKRVKEETLSVLPVIVRTCAWRDIDWLRKIQVLPSDGKSLSSFDSSAVDAALTELVEVIRRIAKTITSSSKPRIDEEEKERAPKGALHGVPQLPVSYTRSARSYDDLMQVLLSSRAGSIAVCGVSGVGKTVLAASVASNDAIQILYPDGIFWLNGNHKPFLPDAFYTYWPPVQKDEDYLVHLEKEFRDRAFLLILDDVQDRESFLPILRALGPRCRLLITSREESFFHDTNTHLFHVAAFTLQECMELLAKEIGVSSPQLLPQDLHQVSDLCNGLPGLVTKVGRALRREKTPAAEALASALNALKKGGATESATSEHVEKEEIVSESTASDNVGWIEGAVFSLTISSRDCFFALAGFQADIDIPLVALASLWKIDARSAGFAVGELAGVSLLEKGQADTVRLTDAAVKYLRAVRPDTPTIDLEALLKSSDCLVTLSCDSDEGDDCLSIDADVKAFSSVLASVALQPPLCVGIFGNWGSGKSFFMRKMHDRINLISEKARVTGKETAFCGHVAQITFNAWYYVDANLWASLACRIFEGLDSFLRKRAADETDPKGKKNDLFKNLASSRQMLQEAKQAEKDAVAQKDLKKKEFEELQRERQEKEKVLTMTDCRQGITAWFVEDLKARKKLKDASDRVGLGGLAGNLDKLDEAIKDLQTFWGRLRRLWPTLESNWLIYLIVLLIPLVGIGIEKVLSRFGGNITIMVTQVSAIVAAIAFYVKRFLKISSQALAQLEAARLEVEAVRAKKAAKASAAELELQKELKDLERREEAARLALKEAEEKLERAENEVKLLDDCADGKLLADFIRERVSSATYHSQLGIISSIRRDLQSLSDLLTDQEKWKKENFGTTEEELQLPKVERIILYIDDLDRCPEQTVVEVLQAVHLLLAFKLFIVVIGVDSRWLFQSLRHHYAVLRRIPNSCESASDNLVIATSTPQNYLEKIIQVPFNLRAMDDAGFLRLMHKILPCEERHAFREAEEGVNNDIVGAMEAVASVAEGNEDSIKTQSSSSQPQDTEPEPTIIPGGEPAATKSLEQLELTAPQTGLQSSEVISTEEGSTGTESKASEFDLTPESLKITPQELKFLTELSVLIPTPRSGKTFANLYRLLRAGIPSTDLPRYLGETGTSPEYPSVIALLAIQVGFPLLANEVFRLIHSNQISSWSEIRDSYASGSQSGSENAMQLRLCLDILAGNGTLRSGFERCGEWVPRVSRYSFRGFDLQTAGSKDQPDRVLTRGFRDRLDRVLTSG